MVVLNWKEFFLLFLAVLGLCRCTQFLYLWPLAAGSLPLHAVSLPVATGGWVFAATRKVSLAVANGGWVFAAAHKVSLAVASGGSSPVAV